MINIKLEDISMSVYNTGGSWFPKFNGVELVHLPTGIKTRCATERSQHANKEISFAELQLQVDKHYSNPTNKKIVFYIRIEYPGTDFYLIGKVFRTLRARFPFMKIEKVEQNDHNHR